MPQKTFNPDSGDPLLEFVSEADPARRDHLAQVAANPDSSVPVLEFVSEADPAWRDHLAQVAANADRSDRLPEFVSEVDPARRDHMAHVAANPERSDSLLSFVFEGDLTCAEDYPRGFAARKADLGQTNSTPGSTAVIRLHALTVLLQHRFSDVAGRVWLAAVRRARAYQLRARSIARATLAAGAVSVHAVAERGALATVAASRALTVAARRALTLAPGTRPSMAPLAARILRADARRLPIAMWMCLLTAAAPLFVLNLRHAALRVGPPVAAPNPSSPSSVLALSAPPAPAVLPAANKAPDIPVEPVGSLRTPEYGDGAVAVASGPSRSRRAPVSGFRGSLAVRSTPSGARIFLNGVAIGTTPLVVQDLPVGSRAVRVELPGYRRWSTGVRVVHNQRTTMTAQLEPMRPQ